MRIKFFPMIDDLARMRRGRAKLNCSSRSIQVPKQVKQLPQPSLLLQYVCLSVCLSNCTIVCLSYCTIVCLFLLTIVYLSLCHKPAWQCQQQMTVIWLGKAAMQQTVENFIKILPTISVAKGTDRQTDRRKDSWIGRPRETVTITVTTLEAR